MNPGFRRSPRRDSQQLRTSLADLRLWEILKSELAQGRTGSAYARDQKDTQTGGHMQGHPLMDMVERSDVAQTGTEGLQLILDYVTNRGRGSGAGEQGLTQRAKNRIRSAELDANEPLDFKTTVIGRYSPEIRDTLPPVGAVGDLLRRGAQFAGVVGRDLMKQGPQGIYWFLNAPEAIASVGAMAAQHGSLHASRGRQILGRTVGARDAVSPALATRDVYRTPGAAVAASIPMIGLVGLASGALIRQEGYKALYPEEGEGADPRQSANPLLEGPMRVLGRGGGLLAYGDFVQERPDVSKGQYTAYQAYLQGNKSPIKATTEGIHGPELTLFGKSLPVLTALVPAAVGLIGARRGYRMAGNRLAGRGVLGRDAPGTRRPDEFARLASAYDELNEARRQPIGDGGEDAVREKQARVQQAEVEAFRRQKNLDNALVGGSILGSTVAIGPTVALTQQLEQFRRASNWEANREAVAISVLEAEEQRKREAEAAAETQAAVAARGAEALAGLTVLQGR